MKKRILTVALVVALLATCFAGTYAYLQDSKAQTNTFTTGNVLISLDEAKVEKDEATGNLVAKKDAEGKVERTTADQEYKLFPGMTVTKDPTITLVDGSEDAWVAAKVTFTYRDAYKLLSGGVLETDAVDVVQDGNVVYVYVKTAQTKDSNPIVLFDTLKVPADWGNTEMGLLNNMTIDVRAFAVQKHGFADCKTAMKTAFPNAFSAN